MRYQITQKLTIFAFIVTSLYMLVNLAVVMEYFGEFILYGQRYMLYPQTGTFWIIRISIMSTLIISTSILYIISCRQRKQQTRKPLRFTTTKLLLIPLTMLISYPLLHYFVWNYPFWLLAQYPGYMDLFPMYGLLVYCFITPILVVLMVCSFFMDHRQRRKEQQKRKDAHVYTVVTD
jgi:preprotein translocase subunit YajC